MARLGGAGVVIVKFRPVSTKSPHLGRSMIDELVVFGESVFLDEADSPSTC